MIDQALIDKIIEFNAKRDWDKFHNPKDLSLSIVLEAAELLEVFQWSGQDLDVQQRKLEMEEELADIIIYSILFAHAENINIREAITNKLARNENRFPLQRQDEEKLEA